MRRIGAWRIQDKTPIRLRRSEIDLEKDLEGWITQDPAMVGEGYRILARQLSLPLGGRLDLLAADPQGQLVVIEIKRGAVYQDTLVQALGYAAALAKMQSADLQDRIEGNCRSWEREIPEDLTRLLDSGDSDRDVFAVAVGCGMDPGTEQLLDYLSGRFGVTIRAISFEVFDHEGAPVLTREVAEVDQRPETRPRYSIEAVLSFAGSAGFRAQFEVLLGVIEKHPRLHPKPWAMCVMCAPRQMRTRALFTFWAERDAEGRMKLWVGPEAFEEFFGVPADDVQERLGKGFVYLDEGQVREFAVALDDLMQVSDETAGEGQQEPE